MTSAIPSWTEAELRAALDRYESELRLAGKARNTVTTYVQHPERFINWLVGGYSPSTPSSMRSQTTDLTRSASTRSTTRPIARSSKYDPLRDYLAAEAGTTVRLSFAQVESILGQPLPASARRYRPWWANGSDGTHVHARSWLDAGRRTTNVDLNASTVDFVR